MYIEKCTSRPNKDSEKLERSQELFNKMNVILNKDYRSKIGVTSLLKNYAEKHDIELFSISLLNLLKTTKQRLIFSQLRFNRNKLCVSYV